MTDQATIPENEHPLLAGRYRVVRRLGAGGMGEVFLVEDLKLGNSRFAVKMLPAWLGSHDQAAEALREEARLAIGLSHTNIVTTRAFDVLPSGQPYLVMDFVDGRTLAEVLQVEGRMSCEAVQVLFGPIAAALDYAHSKGVVHRDIKPSNIMIRSDGTPVIMDFGVAREVKEASVRVTGAASSGTLCYMSPEQLRGEHPAPAQDVYGLAATMWECLFGEPPFARGDVHHQILNETPSMQTRGVASHPLAERLLQSLAKKPQERPPSCGEVLGEGAEGTGGNAGPRHAFRPDECEAAVLEWSRESVRRIELDVRRRRKEAELALGEDPDYRERMQVVLEDADHLLDMAGVRSGRTAWRDAGECLAEAGQKLLEIASGGDAFRSVRRSWAAAEGLASALAEEWDGAVDGMLGGDLPSEWFSRVAVELRGLEDDRNWVDAAALAASALENLQKVHSRLDLRARRRAKLDSLDPRVTGELEALEVPRYVRARYREEWREGLEAIDQARQSLDSGGSEQGDGVLTKIRLVVESTRDRIRRMDAAWSAASVKRDELRDLVKQRLSKDSGPVVESLRLEADHVQNQCGSLLKQGSFAEANDLLGQFLASARSRLDRDGQERSVRAEIGRIMAWNDGVAADVAGLSVVAEAEVKERHAALNQEIKKASVLVQAGEFQKAARKAEDVGADLGAWVMQIEAAKAGWSRFESRVLYLIRSVGEARDEAAAILKRSTGSSCPEAKAAAMMAELREALDSARANLSIKGGSRLDRDLDKWNERFEAEWRPVREAIAEAGETRRRLDRLSSQAEGLCVSDSVRVVYGGDPLVGFSRSLARVQKLVERRDWPPARAQLSDLEALWAEQEKVVRGVEDRLATMGCRREAIGREWDELVSRLATSGFEVEPQMAKAWRSSLAALAPRRDRRAFSDKPAAREAWHHDAREAISRAERLLEHVKSYGESLLVEADATPWDATAHLARAGARVILRSLLILVPVVILLRIAVAIVRLIGA